MLKIHLSHFCSLLKLRDISSAFVLFILMIVLPFHAGATEKTLQEIPASASFDPASCTQPEWPAGAKESGKAGTVVMAFLIDKNGHPKRSRLLSTSGYLELDDAAQAALSKCTFRPGTIDGKPVEAWIQVEYAWIPLIKKT